MKKSETRLFLEEQFEKLEQKGKQDPASAEMQSPDDIKPEEFSEDSYLKAPLAYKREVAELFATLSPEMRKYLHERESEVEKGFSRLNNELQIKHFLDQAFSSKGMKHGFKNSKDWIEKLIMVEDLLDENPAAILSYLAKAYGVDFGGSKKQTNSELQLEMLARAISNLEEKLNQKEKYSAELMVKAKDAQKAKEAAFSPRGRAAVAKDPANMSTREFLEMQFADYQE